MIHKKANCEMASMTNTTTDNTETKDQRDNNDNNDNNNSPFFSPLQPCFPSATPTAPYAMP